MGRVVDRRIALKAVVRGTPTVASGRKAAVPSAPRPGVGTPPGSQSGACLQRGSAGTWESHRSPGHRAGRGDRQPTSPGVARELPAGYEPATDTTHAGSRQGIGDASDKRRDLRWAGGSLRGASYQGRGGTQAHGTHGRAGDAGPHGKLERKTGETVSAPTVPPPLPRLAAQAAHAAARVLTTLAPLLDAAVLREAYRPTNTSSAAGLDGGTAQP